MRINRLGTTPAIGLVGMPPVNPVMAPPSSRVGASAGRARAQSALTQRATSALASGQQAGPQQERVNAVGLASERAATSGFGGDNDSNDAFGTKSDSFERGGISPWQAFSIDKCAKTWTEAALTKSNLMLAGHRTSKAIIANIGR